MSNVLGTINPIDKVINIAKKNKIETLIDAAQSVSHIKIDVKKLDCDYLVFSGHKIIGPTGVGVLYGKKNKLDSLSPFLGGVHMIKEVSKDYDDVNFEYADGLTAFRKAMNLKNEPPCEFELSIDKVGDKAHVLKIKTNVPTFGSQPFFCYKTKNWFLASGAEL